MLPASATSIDRTRVDTAVRVLRERILGGAIAPGARLMISPVAKELDMSIIPVREAVKRLESEGLVDHVPHKGARVRPISVKDLADLYRLRVELESFAVREAALRITPRDETQLLAILDSYRAAYEQDRVVEGQQLHAAFHLGLYGLAQSPWLLRTIRPLCDAAERYQRYAGYLRGGIDQRYLGHRHLLACCMTGDPVVAGESLEQHLVRSLDLIRAQIADQVLDNEQAPEGDV